ncbi:2-hydroxyacid dehydrogenase [Roseomonas sp. NAR14]|uniref:2-hydroxyacid dehydrogenase n=1 Tax=Roseomonas acroporae TaxID=2937791 RepID=A0A9X1Y4Y9_9PROT|nr:2-hydroxyacid dehydrogenase [Roseomonas acroporae]MCK8783383.1 2-hydroxyacid dehydrogenase [Roseomonas acroporae]
MKPQIILIEPMMAPIEAKLDAAYQVHRLPPAGPGRDAMIARVAPEVRGVATGGGAGIPRPIMDALPHLGIVAINGIGTDAVDLAEAKRRGIRVTTTPDVLTDDVADLGMALLLAGCRGLCTGDRYVRAGKWGKEGLPLARKASGKRLGILGLGRIGRAIARRAEAFDMEIAYHDIRAFDGVPYRYIDSLAGLAAWSEILMVAASGGAQSRGIVDAAVMDALGPDGLLVNIARGSVVDEKALVAALTEKRLGGAALDVFADEPRTPEALWSMENVVLQPHRASATVETRTAMGELVVANLAAFFAGKEPLTAVV